jgi:hypothetical protein
MRHKLSAAVLVALLMFVATRAQAFNWLSLADLAQLLGTEAGGFTSIARVVHDLVEITSNVKEQTSILKTAYKGIDDAINMRWSDAERDIVTGLRRSSPDFDKLFRNIHDIEDLRYTDGQAQTTLRNMLFATAYGPAVDYLHQQHEDLDTVASTAEVVERQRVLVRAQRSLLMGLRGDCERGAGACQVASQRAAIETANTLTDIQEVLLESAATQQQLLTVEDQKVAGDFYAQQRFAGDFIEHARMVLGPALSRDCRPGHCVESAFAGAAGRVIRTSRQRHQVDTLPSNTRPRRPIVTAQRG